MIQPTTLTLSSQQIEQFENNGYLIIPTLFSAEEVAELRDAFMAQAKDGAVEGLSSRGEISDPNDPLYRYPRMMHPHHRPQFPLVHGVSKKYLLDRRVHDVLADLYGEEPIACQTMFYFKPPGSRGQDLHQDNYYLRVKPGTCMAAWTAIDDSDEENGGLVVVPGTHKMDVQCPTESDRSIFFTGHRVDPPAGTKQVPVNMKAGDVLFFNGSIIHGSYGNTSKDRFRRAFICHYAPSSAVEVNQGYPLYDFDGQPTRRQPVTGGGPCGEVVGSPVKY